MRRISNTVEAATYLNLSPRTLERWRCLGKGPPFYKLGGRVVYNLDALDTWLGSQEYCGTDPTYSGEVTR